MLKDTRILEDPEPLILIAEFGESSVDLAVRAWVKREDYLHVRSDLLETIMQEFDAASISIPCPQREMHIRQPVTL